MNILVAFIIAMAILLIALIKFKVSPSIGLFTAAIIMGFLSGVPLKNLIGYLGTGFGNTMKSIGLVIIFGGVFGEILRVDPGPLKKWPKVY